MSTVVEQNQTETDHENNHSSSKTIFQRLFHKKAPVQNVEYRMIGNYVLGETLGMGGYSKVKLGIHKDTQQKVALKIMFGDENGTISDSKKKQLKRELNVMKKVQHPNVIQLIEFHEDVEYPAANGAKQSCLVTVLEFAPGGELFDFLMFTGCFTEEATRTYLHQFLDGLEAMHKMGIAHRDLKPENLLMDADYNLKIADFGFATEFKLENGTQIMMNTSCGTKGYLAPELLKGKKYTQKCDLFAVGIILFTTYAGFPPFQTATESDWWWEKLSKAWILLESAKTIEDKNEKELREKKSKEKFDLFWKAHERSREFKDQFKDLSTRILHPQPEIRYDISDVRNHEWSKGQVLGKNEIKTYMDKRIRSVLKERALKVKQQLEDQGVGSKSYTVRSGSLKSAIAKRVEKLDPNNEFNEYLDHIKDDTFINTYYQFLTVHSPNVVAARIEQVADRLASTVSFSPSQHLTMIRATVTYESGEEDDVIIAVKQFIYQGPESVDKSDDVDNDSNDDIKENDYNVKKNDNQNNYQEKTVYLVSFKRLKGSSLSYKRVIEDYYHAIEITEIMEIDDVVQL